MSTTAPTTEKPKAPPAVVTRRHQYEFEFAFDGLESAELGGLVISGKFAVGANRTPGQAAVLHLGDGSGSPGCGPEWDWKVLDVWEVTAERQADGKPVSLFWNDELKAEVIRLLTLSEHHGMLERLDSEYEKERP